MSRVGDEALESTSAGLRLGSESHLDRHYYALQKEYEDTLRSVGLKPGWHVLDAGSGNGLFLPLMSQLLGPTGEIHALDLALELADHGLRNPQLADALTDLAASSPGAEHSAFEFGLARILDGLELLINSRRK